MKLAFGVLLLTLSISGIFGFAIPKHCHKCGKPDPILPLEVVYTGDVCTCGETLPYHVEVPKKDDCEIKTYNYGYKIEAPADPVQDVRYIFDTLVEAPKIENCEVKTHSYGYKVVAPPPPQEETRYSFDYHVEIPHIKEKEHHFCGDLTSQVDRVLLPAKDCEHPAGECHCNSYKPDIQSIDAVCKESLHKHHSAEHDDYWSPHRYGKHKKSKRNCLSSSCEQCSTIANLKKMYKTKPVCDEVLQYLPEVSQNEKRSDDDVSFKSKCSKCNTPLEEHDCKFCEACDIQGKFNIFPNLECVCKCKEKGYSNCPYSVDTSKASVIPGLRYNVPYPKPHSHIPGDSRIVYDHLGHKYIERNGHLRIVKPSYLQESIVGKNNEVKGVTDGNKEKISNIEFAKKLLHDYVDQKRESKYSETNEQKRHGHSYIHEENKVVVDKSSKSSDSSYVIKTDAIDYEGKSNTDKHKQSQYGHLHEVKKINVDKGDNTFEYKYVVKENSQDHNGKSVQIQTDHHKQPERVHYHDVERVVVDKGDKTFESKYITKEDSQDHGKTLHIQTDQYRQPERGHFHEVEKIIVDKGDNTFEYKYLVKENSHDHNGKSVQIQRDSHRQPEHGHYHDVEKIVVNNGDNKIGYKYIVNDNSFDHSGKSVHIQTDKHKHPEHGHFHEVKKVVIEENSSKFESSHKENKTEKIEQEYNHVVIPNKVVYVIEEGGGKDDETVQTIHKNADSSKKIQKGHEIEVVPEITPAPEVEIVPTVEPYHEREPYPEVEPFPEINPVVVIEPVPEAETVPEKEPIKEVKQVEKYIPVSKSVDESTKEASKNKLANDIGKVISIFDDHKQIELSEALSKVFHELSYFDIDNKRYTVDKQIYNHATTENYERLNGKSPQQEKVVDTKHKIPEGYVRNVIKSVRTGKLYEIDTVYGTTDVDNQKIITEYENEKYPEGIEHYKPGFVKEHGKKIVTKPSEIIDDVTSRKYLDEFYFAKEQNVKSKTENCKCESHALHTHVKYDKENRGNEFYYKTPHINSKTESHKESTHGTYENGKIEKEFHYKTPCVEKEIHKESTHGKYENEKQGSQLYYRTPYTGKEIHKHSTHGKYIENVKQGKETFYYMEPTGPIEYFPKSKSKPNQRYVYEQKEPARHYGKTNTKINSGPVWYFEPTKTKH